MLGEGRITNVKQTYKWKNLLFLGSVFCQLWSANWQAVEALTNDFFVVLLAVELKCVRLVFVIRITDSNWLQTDPATSRQESLKLGDYVIFFL